MADRPILSNVSLNRLMNVATRLLANVKFRAKGEVVSWKSAIVCSNSCADLCRLCQLSKI